jgi:bifunctional non-homologous end joining protein LigD
VLFPAAGLVKLDLVRYYDAVADRMLPHLVDRPLTLKQCAPDADHCRYLRHSGERAPERVRVVQIQEQTKVGDYMVVDSRAALLTLAQRNIVEFHTWNATTRRLEQPDRIVLDLDPGPDVPWREVVSAAREVGDVFSHLGLESWLKTTGGSGLHVVVPIQPADDWSHCLEFARGVATTLAAHAPARYTTRYARRGRERRILLDYLRNNRTNTSVAAYSVRARANATVSVPIAWDELSPRLRPERWTMKTLPKRLAATPDPWARYFGSRQTLPKTARRRSET